MEIATSNKPLWTAKVWGRTKQIVRGTNFEVHELEVKRGGFCSRHKHRKWNAFHLLTGKLRVELFAEGVDRPSADRILSPGDQFTVAPEAWHRFVATEDCHLLETYWTVDIDPLDIVRADEGGKL